RTTWSRYRFGTGHRPGRGVSHAGRPGRWPPARSALRCGPAPPPRVPRPPPPRPTVSAGRLDRPAAESPAVLRRWSAGWPGDPAATTPRLRPPAALLPGRRPPPPGVAAWGA